MSNKESTTISSCLAAIGIRTEILIECHDLAEEFRVIKRAYYERAKVVHPDKGGDAAAFRAVNEAFEVLRTLFSGSKVKTFKASVTGQKEATFETERSFDEQYYARPWEFYAQAAEELMPIYKVEPAKSDRSQCKQTGSAKKCPKDDVHIAKGEVRIGVLDKESGGYGLWNHLDCWRVPHRIWIVFPQEEPAQSNDTTNMKQQFKAALASLESVLLTGFIELDESQKNRFVEHCMDRGNWARKGKKIKILEIESAYDDTKQPSPANFESTKVAGNGDSGAKDSPGGARAIGGGQIVSSSRFVFPVPGRDADPDYLKGKIIVLTGTFPEIGGGAGLNLGKDRLKGYLEGFGAKVTGSVSGKTNILVVGKEPGAGKVCQARTVPKCKLMTVESIKEGILSRNLDDLEPVLKISNFSSGYRGNGLLTIGNQGSATGNLIESKESVQSGSTAFKRKPERTHDEKSSKPTKKRAKQEAHSHPEPPTQPPTEMSAGWTCYMEMAKADERRFWSISVPDSYRTATSFGKVGAKGSDPSYKDHADYATMVKFTKSQVQAWSRKGYRVVSKAP